MEFTVNLGIGGWALLIIGALVLGVIAQSIGDVRARFQWLDVAVAAFFGGLIASEIIVRWRDFGPVVDGLALVPATLGGLLLGIGVDAGIRAESHGSYRHHAHI